MILSLPTQTPGLVYSLSLIGGLSAGRVKTVLPNERAYFDADRNPQPLVEIANASIVLNITQLQGLDNVTFTCGSYGGDGQFSTEFRPPPRVGTLLVVDGQRLSLAVSHEGPSGASDDGTITVQAELIGDFCKRAPDQTICNGHNAKATSPPLPSGSPSNTSATGSGSGTVNQESVNATSAPPATVPTPAPTKSSSARRMVLSAVVACLALGATML